MNNKFLSLVANEQFVADDLINFCIENFSFKILNTKTLSNLALEIEIENFDINKTEDLKKFLKKKKLIFVSEIKISKILRFCFVIWMRL